MQGNNSGITNIQKSETKFLKKKKEKKTDYQIDFQFYIEKLIIEFGRLNLHSTPLRTSATNDDLSCTNFDGMNRTRSGHGASMRGTCGSVLVNYPRLRNAQEIPLDTATNFGGRLLK